MDTNLFINSDLVRLIVLEVNFKKLSFPSDGAELQVLINAGINLNEEKTNDGYEIIYKTEIKCEEEGEEKLFSLKYVAKATYKIECAENEIKEEFEKVSPYFMRELYNITREYLNEMLFKSKIRFSLPLSLPDDFKHLYPKQHQQED